MSKEKARVFRIISIVFISILLLLRIYHIIRQIVMSVSNDYYQFDPFNFIIFQVLSLAVIIVCLCLIINKRYSITLAIFCIYEITTSMYEIVRYNLMEFIRGYYDTPYLIYNILYLSIFIFLFISLFIFKRKRITPGYTAAAIIFKTTAMFIFIIVGPLSTYIPIHNSYYFVTIIAINAIAPVIVFTHIGNKKAIRKRASAIDKKIPEKSIGNNDLAMDLKSLKNLYDEGFITDAEYEEKRKELLSRI